MDVIFLLLFLASLTCLIIGLIKPTVFSRLIKGEMTRRKIGLIFGVATLILSVLFSIATDSSVVNDGPSNTPDTIQKSPPQARQTQPETGPIETAKPTQHELKAEVKFNEVAFQITNIEDLEWTGCKLEMNAGIIKGGYIYKIDIIPSNKPLAIPFRSFAKSDGTRFNPYETKPQSLSISCQVGDLHGFGYYGIN